MRLNRRYCQALAVTALAYGLDAALGAVFSAVDHIPLGDGLWFAVTTATTVGGDVSVPPDAASRIVALAVMVIVIPLLGVALALFTAGLTGRDV